MRNTLRCVNPHLLRCFIEHMFDAVLAFPFMQASLRLHDIFRTRRQNRIKLLTSS